LLSSRERKAIRQFGSQFGILLTIEDVYVHRSGVPRKLFGSQALAVAHMIQTLPDVI